MTTNNKILLKNGTVLAHAEDDYNVRVLRNTDVLISGNTIVQIGPGLSPSSDNNESTATVIDCTDKIVSPGFTNTHAHLWQTPLKGRHADETLLDYFISGDLQSNHFSGEDLFWAQLAGAMESVDGGTTFVLDHSHCNRDEETAEQLIAATAASGIRAVFAYTKPNMQFSKWDMDEIVPKEADPNANPDAHLDHIVDLTRRGPFGDGRVEVGLAFDAYWLPEEKVKSTFDKVVDGGVKVVTSHVVRVGIFGSQSFVEPITSYNLHTRVPHLVLSHCTNLDPSDHETLARTQIAVSSTPESEASCGHGDPVLLEPGLNTSLGVDCHTANTAFMPVQARTALYLARARSNAAVLRSGPKNFPRSLPGSTLELFNKMTIAGAQAVGWADRTGSLRVGKRADVVVLDAPSSTGMSCVADSDPLAAVVRFSSIGDVETVIVDGVLRKVGGKLCPVTVRKSLGGEETGEELDWDGVRARLARTARDVWARDEKSSHEVARRFWIKAMGVDESCLV